MAKIVIAGRADCPYFAKVELLGDNLVKNLQKFSLHKILIQPDDWQQWLDDTCQKNNWQHSRSPIVWRELVDRGGKGVLIGGANDFQEYAYGYYGVRSDFSSLDMQKIAKENLNTKIEVDAEEAARIALSKPVNICLSKASLGVAYNMINEIGQGLALGEDAEIALRLYDSDPTSEVMETLEGVQMEAFDMAHNLIRKVQTTSNMEEAFSDCSVVVLLDEIDRESEETQNDWLKRNHAIFTEYARVLDEVAKKDVKVLVAGNGPLNFNTWAMISEANNIPHQNFMAMSRMTERTAKSVLAEKLNVNSAEVADVIVWGNAGGSTYVDVSRSRVHKYEGAIVGPDWFSLSVTEMLHDDKWIQKEFPGKLLNRKEQIESSMGHRATRLQASATVGCIQHWTQGSPAGQIFSAGVQSQGEYGVPAGLVFSFPVTIDANGQFKIVEDLELSDICVHKIKDMTQELLAEQDAIYPPPAKAASPPPPPARSPSNPEPKVFANMDAAPTDDEVPTAPESDANDTRDETVTETVTETEHEEKSADEEYKSSED